MHNPRQLIPLDSRERVTRMRLLHTSLSITQTNTTFLLRARARTRVSQCCVAAATARALNARSFTRNRRTKIMHSQRADNKRHTHADSIYKWWYVHVVSVYVSRQHRHHHHHHHHAAAARTHQWNVDNQHCRVVVVAALCLCW